MMVVGVVMILVLMGVALMVMLVAVLVFVFAMIMMVDISGSDIPFTDFADQLTADGERMGLTIHAVHEDIFNAMHRI